MPRDVGAWTLQKLRLLGVYLPAYLQACARARDRVYIDGFAGPGYNRIRDTGELIEGSPLIALGVRATSLPEVAFTRLYMVEKDPSDAQELRDEIARRGGDSRATVITGDVNVVIPHLLDSIPASAPTFVLLDPAGIDPAWSTVQALARQRTELLVNFPQGMAINRNPDSAKAELYFGTSDWRAAWERGQALQLYRQRLRELGYTEQIEHARLVKSDGGQHLYYLIPASKHPVSTKIWHWIFRQPDITGQMPLL